jgi:DeoR/GlpR family transcriptional regulator of sugar metabolism
MLPADRHRTILTRLAADGSVRVGEMARRLAVTEETIRRDLRRLDADGRLVRTHGGAVSGEADPTHDLPMHHRRSLAVPQKRAIGRAAAATVRADSTIALDASSTALEMAWRLPELDGLTVVTPSPLICGALSARKGVTVICTGGVLDEDAVAFAGPLAEATLGRLHVDRCYFSCRGVDFRRGMSEATDRHAALKAAMIDAADHATLLADAGKFGSASSVYFGPVTALDHAIVDDALPEADRRALRDAGVELTLVAPGDRDALAARADPATAAASTSTSPSASASASSASTHD